MEAIEAPDRTKVPRSHLRGIAASLGFDADDVSEILLTPFEVRVVCIDKRDFPPVFVNRTIPVVP